MKTPRVMFDDASEPEGDASPPSWWENPWSIFGGAQVLGVVSALAGWHSEMPGLLVGAGVLLFPGMMVAAFLRIQPGVSIPDLFYPDLFHLAIAVASNLALFVLYRSVAGWLQTAPSADSIRRHFSRPRPGKPMRVRLRQARLPVFLYLTCIAIVGLCLSLSKFVQNPEWARMLNGGAGILGYTSGIFFIWAVACFMPERRL
jgi:hypothetical protein